MIVGPPAYSTRQVPLREARNLAVTRPLALVRAVRTVRNRWRP